MKPHLLFKKKKKKVVKESFSPNPTFLSWSTGWRTNHVWPFQCDYVMCEVTHVHWITCVNWAFAILKSIYIFTKKLNKSDCFARYDSYSLVRDCVELTVCCSKLCRSSNRLINDKSAPQNIYTTTGALTFGTKIILVSFLSYHVLAIIIYHI